jgi:2,4'-dihydroxyacetophenone dioxygenase
MAKDDALMTSPNAFPSDALAEIVQPDALCGEEHLWVPQAENVALKPLCLSASGGYYVILMRMKGSGLLSRHRHASPAHGFVLKGEWHYLEQDWHATAGTYVFEPPGGTHTLAVPQGVEEMISLFHVSGSVLYVDEDGEVTGYDDVFTRIERCRRHYEAVGLGLDYVKQFIR